MMMQILEDQREDFDFIKIANFNEKVLLPANSNSFGGGQIEEGKSFSQKFNAYSLLKKTSPRVETTPVAVKNSRYRRGAGL